MLTASNRKFAVFLFLFFAPFLANGSVVINEIMYNLEGADKGREWVEIFNSGSAPVDLSGWKFFENKTNHKIKFAGGGENFIIPVGGYAVLADRPEKFLLDWPNFSGIIFDTAFSLKNSGESLALRNSELNDVDSVIYNSDWGGDGDGNSLQKIGGKWVGAKPTPGAQNSDPPAQAGVQQGQTAEKEAVSAVKPEPKPQPESRREPEAAPILPAPEVAKTQPQPQQEPPAAQEQNVSHSVANMDADAGAKQEAPKIQRKIQKQKPPSPKFSGQSVSRGGKKPESTTVVDSGKSGNAKHSALDVSAAPQTANAIAAAPSKAWGIKGWLLIILGFGIFASVGFVFIRRQNFF